MPWGSYARTRAPCASSAGTMTRLGASRMSSVLGLNVRPSTAIVLPCSEPPAGRHDLGRHRALAAIVHRHHRRHDAARHVVVLPDRGERGEILGKTRTSETRPCMQELRSDAP